MYKKIAVLIIFSYIDSIDRSKLHSVAIDLYHSYHYALNNNYDDIIVITDIINDMQLDFVRPSITLGVVNSSILSIIEKIKTNNHYYYYKHKKDMIEKINRFVNDKNRIYVYYSGHSSNNNIKLPKKKEMYTFDGECTGSDRYIYSGNEFTENIVKSANDKAEIFMVMDCCQISNMKIPYKYDGIYKLGTDINFMKPKIICFTSTSLEENAMIYTHGSIFSRYLFKLLNKICLTKENIDTKYYSLFYLKKYINKNCTRVYNQTSNLYVSYPNIKKLWDWIIKTNNSMKIEIDYLTKSIKLNRV